MRAVVILVLALGASPAVAQKLSAYAGAGVGEFDHDSDAGGPFSDSVSSWKIYGGFQVGDYFSVEAALGETSTIEVDGPGGSLSIGSSPAFRLQGVHSVDFQLTTIRAMGRVPLKHIDLWMSVGYYRMDADVDFTSFAGVPSSLSVEDSGELLATGVDWKLGTIDQPIRVRLEYERLRFAFSNASAVAVGVAYRFGDL